MILFKLQIDQFTYVKTIEKNFKASADNLKQANMIWEEKISNEI